jgi:glycogen debranching enzyme
MKKAEIVKKAKAIFTLNTISGYSSWKDTDYKFIAPANKEYVYQWLWDTGFHAIVLSHFDTDWAKREIRNFLIAQWENGFLPHIIFWGKKKTLPHWAYIESALSIRPRTTSITQPPIFPITVETIYKKDQDKEFLKEVLPKLALHHKWLISNRDIDHDGLLSIISPNESGMDELPVFQVAAGYTGLETTHLHYTYRKGDILNHRYRFDSKKILKHDYFNVEELLFNVVFIESSRSLSRLFKVISEPNEEKYFKEIADKSEKSLLSKCWDKKDEIFYSLYKKDERFANVKTVASLAPLFLDGLKGEQLKNLVEKHVLNPDEFYTDYPFPSVSKDEKYYVPHDTPFHQVKLLWRGPTWIATNWFVVKGLQKHGYNDIAKDVIKKMSKMIEAHGFREYYNPETGEGYRRQNFGWSTLILDLIS